MFDFSTKPVSELSGHQKPPPVVLDIGKSSHITPMLHADSNELLHSWMYFGEERPLMKKT